MDGTCAPSQDEVPKYKWVSKSSCDDHGLGAQIQGSYHRRHQRPENLGRMHDVRQLGRVYSKQADQAGVVADLVRIAVVGDP
jgi:hypothetical protein